MPTKLRDDEKTKFRKHLDDRGMRIDELSRKTGIKFPTLYQIVMGYHENPSMDTVRLLLDKLGCSFEDIF